MANAYSILHNYDRPLYTPNYNLISTVLQYKQGKLDANRQRLQALTDQLGAIDLAKDEDKEYTEGRIQAAVNIANKYAALDLSSSGLANDLIGKLTEVVDDNVKNAVLSTRRYRSEQAIWEKVKTEKPDEYSEDNYQVAMRNANAWLNDGQIGTEYKGGGGFIKYDNYQKRLQDNIHKIAEHLKATWVDQGNGSGMFIDNITKESVDRGKLDAALDIFIGDSGRAQMQREAWNRSRFVDEEQLAQQYNAGMAKDLEQADYFIENLRSLSEKERNPAKRAEYQSALETWENRRATITSNNYDAVGKEGAYFALSMNDFKGKYLDAYSYGPRIIKREVDQNHVKTEELKERQREFDLNYKLKLRDIKRKEDKALLDAGINPETGLPIIGTIPTGKKEIIGEGEGYKETTVTEKELKDFDSALKGLQAVVPGLGETSLTELAEKVTDKDIASSQMKEYVIGGKKVKLDFSKPEVRNAVINFDKKVISVSPEVKRLREQLGDLKGDVLNKILKEVQVNPNFNEEFPALYQMVVGNSKAGFKVVDTEFDVYQGLLYKVKKNGGGQKGYNSLTEGEKLSLDMCVYTHMMIDPKIDKGMRRQTFNKYRNDMVEKIGYDNFRKLPTSVNAMLATPKFDRSEAKGIVGTALTAVSVLGGRGQIYNLGDRGDRSYLSNLGFWDTESSGASMESLFKDGLENIKRDYDINISQSTMMPTNTSFEVTSQDYRSKALKQAIGQANNKNNVEITFLMNDKGEPDGRVQYSYWEYDQKAKKNVKKWGGILEKEKAEALGFSHTKELKYDFTGDYGKDAHVFDLGGVHKSEVDKPVRERAVKQFGILPMDNPAIYNEIITSATNTGDTELVDRVLKEMRRFYEEPGFIDVKLQGNDEDKMYHLSLRTASGGKYSFPVAKGFSTNEVGNFLYDESLYMKHAIFYQYLNEMIGSEAANAAVKRSQTEIQRLLAQ